MTWYLIIPFVVILVFFLMKKPIGFGMLVGAFVYCLVRDINVGMLINVVGAGMTSAYILIAIPLFVFTANIMNEGTITDKIYSFCKGMMRGVRGSTAYVNVVGSLIFSGMTGSALADASGIGMLEIKQMKDEGYDEGFSAALTATTAVIGPTFPPSIPMVVYAMIASASVGKLFLGGIIPALMMTFALMLYVFFNSKRKNFPKGTVIPWKQFGIDTLKAFPALITPVILLTCIYTGWTTPTEAASVAGAYALLLSLLVYRSLSWKRIVEIVKNTITTSGTILLMVAAAYALNYVITLERADKFVYNLFVSMNLSKTGFLLLVNLFFLLLGCFVDANISQLVFIPVFIPLLSVYGVDKTHFGVILAINIMTGLCTPPFGMLLFVSSGVAKCSLSKVIKESFPMVLLLLAVLLFVTLVPETVTFLSNMVQ